MLNFPVEPVNISGIPPDAFMPPGLRTYDMVLGNPPFSTPYDAQKIQHRHRFAHLAPENRGDLMFVQHMYHTLRDSEQSIMAVIMAHGVLFRQGIEQTIREWLVATEDALEAVIGLPESLFTGSAIPVCVLVLRKQKAQSGKVLFINASEGYASGRNQNELLPEHIFHIIDTYQEFRNTPDFKGEERFSAVVTHEQIADAEYNLNIPRYASTYQPDEPQDVRGHIRGIVPVNEIAAKQHLFDAHNIDVTETFFLPCEEYDGYLNFNKQIDEDDLKEIIESHPGIQQREQEIQHAFTRWWAQERLTGTWDRASILKSLPESFSDALESFKMFPTHQLRGMVADWWHDVYGDALMLRDHGAVHVINCWLSESDSQSLQWIGQSVFSEEMQRIAELRDELQEARKGKRAFERSGEALAETNWNMLIKRAQRSLTTMDKELSEKVASLSGDDAQTAVLAVFEQQLRQRLQTRVVSHRNEVIAAVENWWAKYRWTTSDLQEKARKAQQRMKKILEELGY